MRTLIRFVVVLASIAVGYGIRAGQEGSTRARSTREATDPVAERGRVIATLSEEERESILKRSYPDLVRLRDAAKRTAESSVDPDEADEEAPPAPVEEDDQIKEWLKSASGQWKAYAGMQAKSKVRGLLAGLGFDAATAKQIEAAIVGDVERQVDRAIAMMLGDAEMDPSAFTAMLGIPADLSEELEQELGSYLDDEAISSVRERVQSAHTKQMTDMADMQVNSMGIRDLSDDQKSRMREVFVGQDMMSKQMSQFSELTRNRKTLMSVMQDEEKFEEAVSRSMEPQRRRVREILNDEQFKRYEAYEKTVVQQAKMGMKMMSAMIKPKK
jgi:hypothetical protein